MVLMTTQRQLDKAARQLAELLQQRRLRVVFAESFDAVDDSTASRCLWTMTAATV